MSGHGPHTEERLHGHGSGILGKYHEYLGEFVYGGVDGAVTTFAVVAGAAGAHLDTGIVIILGFANLIADGFSMSVGAYLSHKSEQEHYDKHKQVEYWEVDHMPQKEREEVREIFMRKGFEGPLLEQVVDKICEDRERWVEFMMKEELEMTPNTKSPLGMGVATFVSFSLMGIIPLLAYLYNWFTGRGEDLFLYASVLTSISFVAIGWLKSNVNETPRLKSIAETLLLGGVAAILAYFVGNVLERIFL